MSKSRNTIAKQTIEQLIIDSDFALSHQDISAKVGNLCNRVTIYRILDKMVAQGKVHKIIDNNGVAKYANCNTCKVHHHCNNHIHFNCEKCKTTKCLENIAPTIELPENYTFNSSNIIVTGICANCN